MRKIAVTLDHRTVADLDRWVQAGRYPNRGRALQFAVNLLMERDKRTRLSREVAKLDRAEERRIADDGIGDGACNSDNKSTATRRLDFLTRD